MLVLKLMVLIYYYFFGNLDIYMKKLNIYYNNIYYSYKKKYVYKCI